MVKMMARMTRRVLEEVVEEHLPLYQHLLVAGEVQLRLLMAPLLKRDGGGAVGNQQPDNIKLVPYSKNNQSTAIDMA